MNAVLALQRTYADFVLLAECELVGGTLSEVGVKFFSPVADIIPGTETLWIDFKRLPVQEGVLVKKKALLTIYDPKEDGDSPKKVRHFTIEAYEFDGGLSGIDYRLIDHLDPCDPKLLLFSALANCAYDYANSDLTSVYQ